MSNKIKKRHNKQKVITNRMFYQLKIRYWFVSFIIIINRIFTGIKSLSDGNKKRPLEAKAFREVKGERRKESERWKPSWAAVFQHSGNLFWYPGNAYSFIHPIKSTNEITFNVSFLGIFKDTLVQSLLFSCSKTFFFTGPGFSTQWAHPRLQPLEAAGNAFLKKTLFLQNLILELTN